MVDKIDKSLEWDSLLIGFTGGIEPNDGANFWSVDGGSHLFNLKPQVGSLPIIDRQISDWEKKIDDLYVADFLTFFIFFTASRGLDDSEQTTDKPHKE